jgi:MSHA pilin protein MshC
MPRPDTRRAQAASSRGYTLVELVVVITIAGVLAAFISPRFWTQQTFNGRGYTDELGAALRSAQKAAVITGCPAIVTLSASSYTASQQAAAGNACNTADTSWSTPLLAADGSAIQNTAPAGTTASPAGVFQFGTQGQLVSSPGTTITVGSDTITIDPVTGLVQVN